MSLDVMPSSISTSPTTPLTSPGSSLPAATAPLAAADFGPAPRDGILQGKHRPSLSYWADAWIRLKKNKQAIASLFLIIGLVLFTLVGPFVWRVNPAEQILGRVSENPNFGREVVVLEPQAAWQTPMAPVAEKTTPPAVPVQAGNLPAPTDFRLLTAASVESVRLGWVKVDGAESYALYRSHNAPSGPGDYGVPLTEINSGAKIGFEDTFDLKPGTYYYTLVPKVGLEEAPQGATLQVDIARALPLTAAQKIDPNAKPGQKIWIPARPLGTDYLGRDMLARLMAGARVSLFIGFFAPLLSVLIGIGVGGIAGYMGGKVDQWLMRFTDFVLALPFLLFMILFKVAFGAGPGENGIGPMLIAMIALSWTGAARLTRGQVLQLRESEFVQAARLLGAKPAYLLIRHLLPNTLGVILVSLTFSIPSAIFTEAFLSFIGMGVVPPTPSWGSMCNDGVQTFLNTPHEFVAPAALISLTVLAFNLLGDGLRDALDPKMRSVS